MAVFEAKVIAARALHDFDIIERTRRLDRRAVRRLTAFARANGVRVVHVEGLSETGCLGRYASEGEEDGSPPCLEIDADLPTHRMVMVLAHELGHWVESEVMGKWQELYESSERCAIVYGWRLLGLLDLQNVVTREAWIEEHQHDAPERILRRRRAFWWKAARWFSDDRRREKVDVILAILVLSR